MIAVKVRDLGYEKQINRFAYLYLLKIRARLKAVF